MSARNSITSTNNEIPIRPPSLPKKSNGMNFYNSTYESTFPMKNPSSSASNPQPINSSSTDDLAQLEAFDEQTIINHMYNRFLADQIYTYIGDILVVSSFISRSFRFDLLHFDRRSIHFVRYQSTEKMQ